VGLLVAMFTLQRSVLAFCNIHVHVRLEKEHAAVPTCPKVKRYSGGAG
jgi:hypothetical protein